eukprot:scaffold404_cov171-Prasinococcus_capsulatus_cf.AAC.1
MLLLLLLLIRPMGAVGSVRSSARAHGVWVEGACAVTSAKAHQRSHVCAAEQQHESYKLNRHPTRTGLAWLPKGRGPNSLALRRGRAALRRGRATCQVGTRRRRRRGPARAAAHSPPLARGARSAAWCSRGLATRAPRRRGGEATRERASTWAGAMPEGARARASASHIFRSPVHARLNGGGVYAGGALRVRYESPDGWESVACRLLRRDPVAGCIDPEVRTSAPTAAAYVRGEDGAPHRAAAAAGAGARGGRRGGGALRRRGGGARGGRGGDAGDGDDGDGAAPALLPGAHGGPPAAAMATRTPTRTPMRVAMRLPAARSGSSPTAPGRVRAAPGWAIVAGRVKPATRGDAGAAARDGVVVAAAAAA